jgi:hypothetical protein
VNTKNKDCEQGFPKNVLDRGYAGFPIVVGVDGNGLFEGYLSADERIVTLKVKKESVDMARATRLVAVSTTVAEDWGGDREIGSAPRSVRQEGYYVSETNRFEDLGWIGEPVTDITDGPMRLSCKELLDQAVVRAIATN